MRLYWPGLAYVFGMALAMAAMPVMVAWMARDLPILWVGVVAMAILDGLLWMVAVGVLRDELDRGRRWVVASGKRGVVQ